MYNNGLRNADGTTPRRKEYAALAANASGPATPEPEAVAAAEEHLEDFIGYDERYELSAKNIFKAHKQAIGEYLLYSFEPNKRWLTPSVTEDGLFDFSEATFLKSQGLGWNETSAVGGGGKPLLIAVSRRRY